MSFSRINLGYLPRDLPSVEVRSDQLGKGDSLAVPPAATCADDDCKLASSPFTEVHFVYYPYLPCTLFSQPILLNVEPIPSYMLSSPIHKANLPQPFIHMQTPLKRSLHPYSRASLLKHLHPLFLRPLLHIMHTHSCNIPPSI